MRALRSPKDTLRMRTASDQILRLTDVVEFTMELRKKEALEAQRFARLLKQTFLALEIWLTGKKAMSAAILVIVIFVLALS